jgi:SAM-dependent methyltransferase
MPLPWQSFAAFSKLNGSAAMTEKDNHPHILRDQYRDSRNLDARIRLHQLYSTNSYGWYRWYLDQLDLPAACRILELGCGPGAMWKDNLHRLSPGWQLIMSDYSLGMVQEARQNTAAARQLRFARLDAQAIPFPNASFDAVLANHMLYHVPDQQRAIAEIRRVLKPGGKLYAATNGETHMVALFDLILAFAPSPSWQAFASRGDSWYTSFTLENGASKLGEHFAQVRVARYDDDLVVTDVDALVDYVLSMQSFASQQATASEVALFHDRVAAQIAAHGAVRIHKDAGLFTAQ